MNYEATTFNESDAPGLSAAFDRWCDNPDSWDLAATVAAYKRPRPAQVQHHAEKMSRPACGTMPAPDLAPGVLLTPVVGDVRGELGGG